MLLHQISVSLDNIKFTKTNLTKLKKKQLKNNKCRNFNQHIPMHPYDKLESVLTSSHYKVEFPQKNWKETFCTIKHQNRHQHMFI